MQYEFDPKAGLLMAPKGLFDYSAGCDCVTRADAYIRDFGVFQITVDFRETTFMDSSGIGALITLMRKLPSQSPPIKLIHPSPSILKLMEVCHLHRLFDIERTPVED